MSFNPLEILRGARISYKLFGVVATFLVPVGVLGYLFFSIVSQQMTSTRSERAGADYCRVVKEFARIAIEYRRLTGEYMAGNRALRPELQSLQGQVDDQFRAIEEQGKHLADANATTAAALAKLKA